MMRRSSGIKNRTIFIADNLHIMRGMPDESVDLIYLDPPFNKKKNFSAPIGSEAAGAEFKDAWTLSDVDEVWWGEIANKNEALYTVLDAINKTAGEDLMSYSIYMAIRLLEMHRILKGTGSLYLHCDPTASHYLKMVLDTIFGKQHFRREIIWSPETVSGYKSQVNGWVRGHDVILYYTKSDEFTFIKHYRPHKKEYIARFKKNDERGRLYRDDRSGGRKQFLDETKGRLYSDVWNDIMSFQQASTSKEYVGYPTQKPLALLERVILSSSNKRDVVFDPFCGCATTCIASEKLNRKWIGIDISEMALNLIKRRLHDEYPLDQYTKKAAQVIPLTKAPILQGTQSKNIKDILYGKQRGHCAGCDVHFPYRNLTVDHVIPTSKGGQDIDENKQLLCQSCNSMKGNRMTTDELKAKLARLGIGK